MITVKDVSFSEEDLQKLLDAAQTVVLDLRESDIKDIKELGDWANAFNDDETMLEEALAPFDGLMTQNA